MHDCPLSHIIWILTLLPRRMETGCPRSSFCETSVHANRWDTCTFSNPLKTMCEGNMYCLYLTLHPWRYKHFQPVKARIFYAVYVHTGFMEEEVNYEHVGHFVYFHRSKLGGTPTEVNNNKHLHEIHFDWLLLPLKQYYFRGTKCILLRRQNNFHGRKINNFMEVKPRFTWKLKTYQGTAYSYSHGST